MRDNLGMCGGGKHDDRSERIRKEKIFGKRIKKNTTNGK